MSSKHDYSYAKRHMRLTALFLFSIAMLATGMVVGISDADARGGGGGGAARAGGGGGGAARAGGGGGGRKAQTSISGANHAASRPSGGGGNYAASRPSGGGGNRGNGNAGNVNKGNINTGNVNTGNVNRGNINTGNVNVGNDINIDIDGGYGYGHGGYYHNPIARGVAIGAVAVTTAAVLGSYYYALPPSGCANVVRNGIPYYYCGSVYYQQSWSGDDVVYVVVNP